MKAWVCLLVFCFSAQFVWGQRLESVKLSGSILNDELPFSLGKGLSSTASPGALADHCMWMKNDSIFLFGGTTGKAGVDYPNALNNRLWVFTERGGWSLLSGSANNLDDPNALSSFQIKYGNLGFSHPSNQPGPRVGAAYFTSSSGEFYMYGGYGLASDTIGLLSDLWVYKDSEWTWLAGDSTANVYSIHANLGSPSASALPGARFKPNMWMDADGSIWLFAGAKVPFEQPDSNYNDLWKWEQGLWTWVGGSSVLNAPMVVQGASLIWPEARHSSAGVYFNGKFHVVGGYGNNSTANPLFSDHWVFDGTDWEMVTAGGGKAPLPSAGSQLFSLNDTLYLLGIGGHFGFNHPVLNYTGYPRMYKWLKDDVWELYTYFDIHGWKESGPYGVYSADQGYMNIAADFGLASNGQEIFVYGGRRYLNGDWVLSKYLKFNGYQWAYLGDEGQEYSHRQGSLQKNQPGSRQFGASCLDESNGRMYAFGGYGLDQNNIVGFKNDLWFCQNNEWVWISGTLDAREPGIYGQKSVPSLGNQPGGRWGSVSWVDGNGVFWLFGGRGYDVNGAYGYLNDLWSFDGQNWTWVSGDSLVDQVGVFGVLNQASPSNKPSGRFAPAIWQAANGDVYIFGGEGRANGLFGRYNDLWIWDGLNWTWVGGSSARNANTNLSPGAEFPGGRSQTAFRGTSNGLYLYGGSGKNLNNSIGLLNELWFFNGSSWSLLAGGSNEVYPQGSYGKLGLNHASHIPPGLRNGHLWSSDNGVYLFGGEGYSNIAATNVKHNTLWHFDGSNWSYLNGDTSAIQLNQAAQFSTDSNKASFYNLPSGRSAALSWQFEGSFFIYGGFGMVHSPVREAILSDTWRFGEGNLWNGSSWSLGSAMSGVVNCQLLANPIPKTMVSKDLFFDPDNTLILDTSEFRILGDFFNSSAFTGKPVFQFEANGLQNLREDTLWLDGYLVVQEGAVLNSNNKLVFRASSDSSYGQAFNYGQVNGVVGFEYFLNLEASPNNARYFHLGPVLDGVQLQDFAEGGYINSGQSNLVVNSVWQWDAAIADWVSPSLAGCFRGKGYAIYAGNNPNGTNFLRADGQAGIVRINGSLPNESEVALALAYNSGQNSSAVMLGGGSQIETEGWNLVSNPFPHNIDLRDFLADLDYKGLYIWNGQNFSTWNSGIGINGGSAVLAPGQAFYIQLSQQNGFQRAGYSLVPGTRGQIGSSRRRKNLNPKSGIKLELANGNEGLSEAWLGLESGAHNGFDGSSDAWCLDISQQGFSFVVDSGLCSIATFDADSVLVVPIQENLSEFHSETLSFKANLSQVEQFDRIELQDLAFDFSTDLKLENQYFFQVDTNYSNRFQIVFYRNGHLNSQKVKSNNFAYFFQGSNSVEIVLTNAMKEDVRLEVFNSAGQSVEKHYLLAGSDGVSTLSQVKPGFYLAVFSSVQSGKVLHSMSLLKAQSQGL